MTDVFAGTSCIVTGGSSGIGYALTEALLRRGATVRAVGIPEEGVAAARETLATYENVRCAVVDVTDYEAVRRTVEDAVADCGRLDYLFNNAGIGATRPYEEVTLEFWKQAVDVNLWGVVHGVHAALPLMTKQGSGHIVNTSSLAGIIAPGYQAVYCASKFAVVGMTESLRHEYRHRGIFFSTVCPSYVVTPIFQGTKLPDEAITADEAAAIILAGVERRDAMIFLPESVGDWYQWLREDPARMEAEMVKLTEDRRRALETGGPPV